MALTLSQEIQDLRKRIDEVANQPFTVYLTDLSDGLRLHRDIPLLIQPTGDDFVATFVDAGISATGDTEVESVLNLKDIIIQKFQVLGSIPEGKLGKSPKRQLAALQKLIREVG